MNLSPPTITDIAKLLLCYAPQDLLDDFELSEDSFDEFCEIHNFSDLVNTDLGRLVRIDLITLALYYSNRKLVNHIKSSTITQSFYIEPFVIYSLIALADAESSLYDENLSKQIHEEKEVAKKKRKSKIRSTTAKLKDDKFYKKPRKFIEGLYKSKKWKNKKEAADFITPKLEDYIKQEKLPVEKFNGKPKEDWYEWVYRNL